MFITEINNFCINYHSSLFFRVFCHYIMDLVKTCANNWLFSINRVSFHCIEWKSEKFAIWRDVVRNIFFFEFRKSSKICPDPNTLWRPAKKLHSFNQLATSSLHKFSDLCVISMCIWSFNHVKWKRKTLIDSNEHLFLTFTNLLLWWLHTIFLN